MALDPDIKDRFDELAAHIKDNSAEIVSTRHALKGSIDVITSQLVENTVNIKMHDRRLDKLEELIAGLAKENEARLRAVESIATAMERIPERVDVLEKTSADSGRFSWGDVLRFVSIISGVVLAVAAALGFFLHLG